MAVLRIQYKRHLLTLSLARISKSSYQHCTIEYTTIRSEKSPSNMVKIALNIKANLENIEELKTSGDEFRWCLKFTCSNCGEKSQKWNYISLSDEVESEHGKDTLHFSCKCKLCSRVNTVTIINDTIKSYGADDLGKFKRIVVFDCRGIEPTDFSAREGWIAKAADNGKAFNDVDLSEGEWADYCDKNNQPVGIYEIEHNFERIK